MKNLLLILLGALLAVSIGLGSFAITDTNVTDSDTTASSVPTQTECPNRSAWEQARPQLTSDEIPQWYTDSIIWKTEKINQAVIDGMLTQEQADDIIARFDEHTADFEAHGFPILGGHHGREFDHGHFDRGIGHKRMSGFERQRPQMPQTKDSDLH